MMTPFRFEKAGLTYLTGKEKPQKKKTRIIGAPVQESSLRTKYFQQPKTVTFTVTFAAG